MTIWLFALLLTAIACATLLYAGAGRMVNAGPSAADATRAHFRAQLGAIESDSAIGRLGPAEAAAAKSELAREVMRHTDDAPSVGGSKAAIGIAVALVAVLSVGTYWFLGRPDLPAAPLASRDVAAENSLDLNAAISTIEARLKQNPDDLRGWQVIAPAYVQLGRYDDAVKALRRVNELAPPTADTLTDLGEALMMRNGGSVVGEAMDSFKQAVALDPKHIRSRFYVAGEETRTGDYVAAVRDWNGLLALAQGNEPWVVTAKNGLAFAEAQLNPSASSAEPAVPDESQIDAMVDGLDARLKAQGGSIDEWTRLVRSRMVQGRMADAQAAYEAARKAYPDAKVRTELDVLAADNGLVAK